jgi:hypothetical protein
MNDRFVNPADEFAEILQIIRTGRARVFEVANLALMETYWLVGGFLSRKVAQAGWGKGVVQELAGWLGAKAPEAKGFSAQNLWRMKQFYETFSADPKLSALPRVLPKSDRKRPHENPSIGCLPCRTKDDEVVEYALNRHLSPALVAQYETQMIPKALLREKLHEWSQMLQAPDSQEGGDA